MFYTSVHEFTLDSKGLGFPKKRALRCLAHVLPTSIFFESPRVLRYLAIGTENTGQTACCKNCWATGG
jgi:hypothetical protein